MYDRYILVHPEDGVFLGFAFGLAFFSKLDAVGQVAAPVSEDAHDLLDDPNFEGLIEAGATSVKLKTQDPFYATKEECGERW